MQHYSDEQFESDIDIKRKILSRVTTFAKNASNNIGDLIIDFSTASNYVVDLRGATYNGPNTSIQIAITGSSVAAVVNRLKIIQDTDDPLPTNLNIVFTTTGVLQNISVLQAVINQSGATIAIDFDIIDIDGTLTYIPVGYAVQTASYTENTTYTSTNILTVGQSYTEALSAIDSVIGRLRPAAPQLITATTLTALQSTTTLHRLSDGVATNVITSSDPVFRVSTPFYNDGGVLQAILDTGNAGTIDLSTTTLTSNMLTIVKGTDSSNFYDTIDTATVNTGVTPIADNETQHTIELRQVVGGVTRATNTIQFYKCALAAFPTPINPSSIELAAVTPSRQVSGLRALGSGETLSVSAVYNNVTFNNGGIGYYPQTVGRISGTGFATVSIPTIATEFADMIANTPNTPTKVGSITISDNQFIEGLSLLVKSVNPRGSSAGTTVNTNVDGDGYLVDSVTDTTSTEYSYNHTESLLTNTELMILNGRVQYPYGNWSSYVGGIDYSIITGWRGLSSQPINAGGFSRVRISLPNAIGFVGAQEDPTNYRMSITRSDQVGVSLDGNAPYSGVGIVGNGEGALLLADSTATEKVITFGEVLSVGTTVTIRIELANNTKSFAQTINFTAF